LPRTRSNELLTRIFSSFGNRVNARISTRTASSLAILSRESITMVSTSARIERGSRPDLPNGGRELEPGSSPYPWATFSLLYFFVISHDRRRIVHCNVTRHPTSWWGVQQLREAFPFDSAPRFLIFDRDAKYGWEVPTAVRSLKITPVRTSFQSPWQNGIAERWVGSCRSELLDHVIALNERHLKRLLCEYVSYHHEDSTHLGLDKETPGRRTHSLPSGRISSQPRLGGLHHRYDRAA